MTRISRQRRRFYHDEYTIVDIIQSRPYSFIPLQIVYEEREEVNGVAFAMRVAPLEGHDDWRRGERSFATKSSSNAESSVRVARMNVVASALRYIDFARGSVENFINYDRFIDPLPLSERERAELSFRTAFSRTEIDQYRRKYGGRKRRRQRLHSFRSW
jgi:hypothetical protein